MIQMRPATKRYREKATGVREERYQADRTHIKIGITISALAIPFAIAGFTDEPRLTSGIAVLLAYGMTAMGLYLLRRDDRERHESMMALLRKDTAEGNVTAHDELRFYMRFDRGKFGS